MFLQWDERGPWAGLQAGWPPYRVNFSKAGMVLKRGQRRGLLKARGIRLESAEVRLTVTVHVLVRSRRSGATGMWTGHFI